jgi:membrane protein
VSAGTRRRPRRGRPFSAVAVGRLFTAAFLAWRRDNAGSLAAALAYYTLFTIPPFLILLLGVAATIVHGEAVPEHLVLAARDVAGREGAKIVRDLVEAIGREKHHTGLTVVGGLTLVLGASGIFGHLKESLNAVWEIEPKPRRGVLPFVRRYLFSMGALLGTGFLLLASLALNALLGIAGHRIGALLPGGETLWRLVNTVGFLSALTVLFALMFRFIPDAVVGWKDALVGGAVTAVLFVAGENLIGLYLGRSSVGSAFGVAGSIVVLLVWIYYSSQIFFFGAEFTRVYADRYGTPIHPDEDAAPAEECAP